MAYSDHLDTPFPPPRAARTRASASHPEAAPPFRGLGDLPSAEPAAAAAPVRERRGHRAVLLAGRAIVGGYFLYSGLNHFMNRAMMTGYARSKGVPFPDVAVAGTGAMIVAGGLSLLTGVKPAAGASLIAAFLLGVSPKMHDFWAIDDEAQRLQETIHFMKNMALVGGAAFAAAVPEPWPVSLRRRA